MAVSPSLEQPPDPNAYGPTGRSEWMDVDWRDHQRWLTIAGRQVNVVDVGSGPAVVLVHGLGANWQCWLENICALARSRRVIAFDLPGFGNSEMPAARLSIKGYGRCIDEIMTRLGIDSAVLIGNSLGGFIAAETAIAFPARVERMILIGPAALWNERRRARPLATGEKILRGYVAWLAAQWEGVHRRPRLRKLVLRQAGVRYPLALPPELTWELMCGTGKPGFSDALQELLHYKIRERMPEIACPTLVVWGRNDPLVPVRQAAQYDELISDSRGVVYEDTGHLPMLERPARFNAEMLAFLDEDPGEQQPAPENDAPRAHGSPSAGGGGSRPPDPAVR
ncbi:MAG: alpha/beta hydrolase [Actinomycetota bacterium]|nr:alpha/beta hydrolase [Actinomycetota bacterium]